jgi:hypothetical protein
MDSFRKKVAAMKNHIDSRCMNLNFRIFRPAVIPLLFVFAMIFSASSYSGDIPKADVELFAVKCGLCHSWKKATDAFAGPLAGKQAVIVTAMQQKKSGFISDAESKTIARLLTDYDLKRVAAAAAAVPRPSGMAPHMVLKTIKIFHGSLQTLSFLLLGIYMSLTGLKRFFIDIKKFEKFPVKFNRKKHAKLGKIYVVLVILGFFGGLAIFVLQNFHAGPALPHLVAGAAVAFLYAVAGIAGLKLAGTKGPSPTGLKYTHLVCVTIATLLFVFNIVSGIMLVLK